MPDDWEPQDLPERPDVPLDLFPPPPPVEKRETRSIPVDQALPRRPGSAFAQLPQGAADGTGEAAVVPEGAKPGREDTQRTASPGRGAQGTGAGTGGGGDGNLVVVYSPKPEYPLLARRKHWEGVVVLELTVEPSGIVSAAKLVGSSGCEALDQSALEKVKEWRYERRAGGTPATALLQRVRCVFRLDP